MWPHEKFFYSITLPITKLLILNYSAKNSLEAQVGFFYCTLPVILHLKATKMYIAILFIFINLSIVHKALAKVRKINTRPCLGIYAF